MAQNNEEIINDLNDLIETCKDGEKGFWAGRVTRVGEDGDPHLQNHFEPLRPAAGWLCWLSSCKIEVLRRGEPAPNPARLGDFPARS